MSFTVSKDRYGDFVIKLKGIRKKYKAKNYRELTTAISHYFSIIGHNRLMDICPLCRADDEEGRKPLNKTT